MKYLRQLAIILAVTFTGELLHRFIPLPVPASIYGLLLMLTLLCTHALRLDQVKDAADFLITLMPVMFVAPLAGIYPSWDALKPLLLPLAVISIVSTALTMGITGRAAQWIMRLEEKLKK